MGPGCGAFSFCFGDDVANGCQEGRHHLLSLMMLWALFVELVGLDGWMFDGGEILVSCLMVAKGISISTPSVFDTLLPVVGFPIIFRERNTHTHTERESGKKQERDMESVTSLGYLVHLIKSRSIILSCRAMILPKHTTREREIDSGKRDGELLL